MSSIMRRRSGVFSAIGGLLQGESFDSSNPVSLADRLVKPLKPLQIARSGLVQSGLPRGAFSYIGVLQKLAEGHFYSVDTIWRKPNVCIVPEIAKFLG